MQWLVDLVWAMVMANAKGMILLWSGAVVDIPTGWLLCDGTAGTPNLRNRFIIGAGQFYNPGDTGGSNTHNHSGTTNGHSHALGAGVPVNAGAGFSPQTSTKTDSFTTSTSNNVPLYYALCYIMKA